MSDHEDDAPLSRANLMPPPLPTDLVPEAERKTDPAPADPVMRLLNEIVAKIDAIGIDVSSTKRRVANLAIEVNATKNQAVAATAEARAAHAATVALGDTVDAVAFMLKDEIGGGLAELDRKLDKTLDRLTSTNIFHDYQLDHLMRWSQAHEGKQADDAHGIDHGDDGPNGNGNGNGHDPDIEIVSAE